MKKLLVFCMILAMLAGNVFAGETTKLNLDVWERIRIKEFLPQKSTFVKATIVNDFSKKIEFTQEEIEEFEIRTKGTSILWKKENSVEKEYECTRLEIKMLKDGVEKKSKEEKIETNDPFIALCEKIMEAKPEEKEKE